MASSAAASNSGEAQNTDGLSSAWQKALRKRRDVVDLLKGHQPAVDGERARFLGVPSGECLRGGHAQQAGTLMNQSFDPTKGFCKTMHKTKRSTSKCD